MANKSVFASAVGKLLPRPDSRNREGALAFEYTPEHKLAQVAVTGCFNGTFYAEAREQLAAVLPLTLEVEPAFIAQTAVYCRERGYMKDMPALLVAALTVTAPDLLAPTFRRVIDNGRMVRNFVQIMRSGTVGGKSLGSRPKALVQDWLNGASDSALILASVGQAPALADLIKMVHPKPRDPARVALHGYLIGRHHDAAELPAAICKFERFKRERSVGVPDAPFQMLTALALDRDAWAAIARQAGWQMLRTNLNTFARHGVFDVAGMTEAISARLRAPREIARARVFRYQVMAAHAMADGKVPGMVREASQGALEIAIANVPKINGQVVVCPDVSGSMGSPVTGYRRGASSAVRCVDVGALVAAACLRRNPIARVLPFEHRVVDVDLNPRDSVLTNAGKLAAVGGGGTNCSAPLARLNHDRAPVDLVVIVSDNQSWVDGTRDHDTATLREWAKLKARNPDAKLACIDLQPYGTTQGQDRADILNVGGFSDAVFDVVAAFATGRMNTCHWVGEIRRIEI